MCTRLAIAAVNVQLQMLIFSSEEMRLYKFQELPLIRLGLALEFDKVC